MAEETRSSWRREIVMLLIGAFVGVGGTWVSNTQQASSVLKNTQVQQEYQMKQVLFSARIVVLKSYGAAVNKSNIAVIFSILDLNDNLLTANSSQEAAIRALKSYDKTLNELLNWKREIGEEAVIMEVLFKAKTPQIEPLTLTKIGLTEDNFSKLADEKERSSMISLMKKNENEMLSHAIKIVSEAKAYIDQVSNIVRGDNP
jgi:hypothetical protein